MCRPAILLTLLLLVSALEAVAAGPGDRNWIIDPARGCGTSNPFPQDGDAIRWDGGCRNGMLDGPGTLIWLQGGVEYERDEGSFVDGELDGPAVIGFPDGRRIHGSYRRGIREGEFTIADPGGAHVRAVYRDGELVSQYRMSEAEIERWRQALPPPALARRPLTEVVGRGSEVRTTTAPPPLAAPASPPPAPAPPPVAATAPAPPPAVPAPAVAQPAAPAAVPSPPLPPTVRPAPSLLPEVAPRPRPPAPAVAAAPTRLSPPPAARPPAPAGVGAVPIFGHGGTPPLRQPGSGAFETVVIDGRNDGRPIAAPPPVAGLRLRPPADALAADDLPPGLFDIELRGARLDDAAAAVFGTLLRRPYSVEPGLDIPITLAPARPIAADELLVAFRDQLWAGGAELRRTSEGYRIVAR